MRGPRVETNNRTHTVRDASLKLPFQITATLTCYLLPQDGEIAKQDFLKHISDPGETYIIAYAFTLVPMIDDLITAHQNEVPLHIFLDHSQTEGALQKPDVQRLVNAGIEVTIGTSPAGQQYICHTKGLVSNDSPVYCWEGSTNFSETAWDQVNTVMVFSSQEWYDNFVAQFNQIRQYAWTNEKEFQLMANPPPGVS